jgi:hypothetical protein
VTAGEQDPPLTQAEALTIAAALSTVAPSGGGSTPFHLAERLKRQFGLSDEDVHVTVMNNLSTVLGEAKDNGVIADFSFAGGMTVNETSDARRVQQQGFDIIGRTMDDITPEGETFDKLTGQAAICGTLSVARLLVFIRPYVVQREVPDLDAYAHIILDL